MVRRFVWEGGGLIGVGEPTARMATDGPVLALSDVFGVDREIGWTLSYTRHLEEPVSTHFITTDLDDFEWGEDPGDIVSLDPETQVLRRTEGSVRLAARQWGAGRAVYLAGLPYSSQNSRLLHRAIAWAGSAEEEWDSVLASSNPDVEVAYYPQVKRCFVYNGSERTARTQISGGAERVDLDVELPGMGSQWIDL